MALTKDKKLEIVNETAELLKSSKLTVVADYQGTGVKQMQQLRRDARGNGTRVKVIKNRLFMRALAEAYSDVEAGELTSQLIYAFNSEDEVAPAQALNEFRKVNANFKFVGAYDASGNFISAEDVQALANLPGKEQLRAQLVGTLAAPLSGFVNVLNGNLADVLNVLKARAEAIG